MIAFLRGFLVLAAAGVAWWAAVWFAWVPDFSQWSLPALVGVHGAPPVFLWAGWLGLRRYARSRAEAAAADKEKAEEAERQAAQEAVRQEREAALAKQRFGCDCRGVAMTQVRFASSEPLELEAPGVSLREADPEGEAPENDILEALRPGIADALAELYAACPAALEFPLYLRPPAEVGAEEAFACLKAIRQELLAAPGAPAAGEGALFFLPHAGSVADAAIALFEAVPDLPGAVLLGFDSPCLRAREDEEGDPERKKWLGKPGQGVFALLLTNPGLNRMLDALGDEPPPEDHDALTPFWERGTLPTGWQRVLARLALAERRVLWELPVLARIHRAALADLGTRPNRSLEMAKAMTPIVESARLSAGLEAVEGASPECGWLVHNAGGVDRSGHRLASLGVVLTQQGFDLDPIDCATNLAVRLGDLGEARSLGLLAITVAQAASQRAAALCAEYSGDRGVALYFAAPVATGEEATT